MLCRAFFHLCQVTGVPATQIVTTFHHEWPNKASAGCDRGREGEKSSVWFPHSCREEEWGDAPAADNDSLSPPVTYTHTHSLTNKTQTLAYTHTHTQTLGLLCFHSLHGQQGLWASVEPHCVCFCLSANSSLIVNKTIIIYFHNYSTIIWNCTHYEALTEGIICCWKSTKSKDRKMISFRSVHCMACCATRTSESFSIC